MQNNKSNRSPQYAKVGRVIRKPLATSKKEINLVEQGGVIKKHTI